MEIKRKLSSNTISDKLDFKKRLLEQETRKDSIWNNWGINPRRHNNNIDAPNTGGLQRLQQMLPAIKVKTERGKHAHPVHGRHGRRGVGACQGLGSPYMTHSYGQSITRLHTHTELSTSHRRTDPPCDSWGSSWPCLWEAPWYRHGTRESQVRTSPPSVPLLWSPGQVT